MRPDARAAVALGMGLLLAGGAGEVRAADCAALKALRLPQVTVLAAESRPSGMAMAPAEGGRAAVKAPTDLCRVSLRVTTSPASAIHVEVWLPTPTGWNGRFLGTGNGGAAGRIVTTALADGVSRGYATVNTDFGTHAPATADAFRALIGKPEVQADLEDRGAHVMTEVGKAVATAYYAHTPETSLFLGCSAGGGEGLNEALRYPGDYDGIAIGDPPIDVIYEGFLQGQAFAESRRDPAAAIGREKLPAIAAAVLDRCDGLDGLRDGLIADPRRCLIDPEVLRCAAGADRPDCLTPAQIVTLRRVYGGLRAPTGELLYAGFSTGAEGTSGALARIAGFDTGSAINPATPGPLVWSLPPGWKAEDWLTFDFATRMMPLAQKAGGPTSRDLRAFAARGGKLILFSGWHDALQNAAQLIAYYEQMQKLVGGPAQAAAFSRMFVFPGMGHCGGGVGPNYFVQTGAADHPPHLGDPRFDVLAALEGWVGAGAAPESLIAVKYEHDDPHAVALRERPACAYPTEARWTGRGSTLSAENYVCRRVED